MEMKYDVTVTQVGSLAPTFLENNSSFILLDENIRPNLADMVLEHTHGELAADIVPGDRLKVGNTDFKVTAVGNAANGTIREEGHCTIVVNGESTMPGQIAVKGAVPPRLRVGDQVQFYTK